MSVAASNVAAEHLTGQSDSCKPRAKCLVLKEIRVPTLGRRRFDLQDGPIYLKLKMIVRHAP
jgi:hypothetical protein